MSGPSENILLDKQSEILTDEVISHFDEDPDARTYNRIRRLFIEALEHGTGTDSDNGGGE